LSSSAHPDVVAEATISSQGKAKVAHLPLALSSLTIFLGAFLLFLIEPLFAKLILPWFGGSAAVWATCLVFFQSALLLGYLYADILTRRLDPRRQSLLHITLLLASLLFLPIAPHAWWRPHSGGDPAWHILVVLTASIGAPFILLSATSPLVQAWHARNESVSEPYHLFALSNLASLLALLSFPFLVEPRLTSHQQGILWSALFVVFAVFCSLAAWRARRGNVWPATKEANTPERIAAPSLADKLIWLSLSACGSILLLSVTNHLTENVAAVPLLWVIPLAFYLLTFTLAFNRRSLYSRELMVGLLAVTLGSWGYAVQESSVTESIQVSVPLFSVGLFICCLFCHGELAARRPAARHLTSFYLMVSLGGALGATFVGLLAPHIFSAIYELPLALILMAFLAAVVLWSEGWMMRVLWVGAVIAMFVVFVRNVRSYEKDSIVTVRSFYGALRVKEFRDWLKQPYHTLYNGTIEHGAQFVNPPMSLQPTTYYGADSGVGLALDRCCHGPKRVGVVGLGTGTLAAYGKSGDYFRFYEINPQVVRIANASFSYLRDTPARTEITLGDARLSLESEPSQQFDVLAVDAFSGDAIPVHLLTRQAFTLYLHHLKPDGILAIHTSNTYLDLAPVVQLLAHDAGYAPRLIVNNDNRRKLIDSSDWMLVTRNKAFLDDLEDSVLIETVTVPPHLRLWTDDYNNLFQILRPVKFTKRGSE
jgi:hypothetical protein